MILTRCISMFISSVYLLVQVARKTKQAIILNLRPLFITYTFIHVCGCIYDPVVMQIIYLTFNLRTVLGMGSNSAVDKNTSFCISCLQPWNNLANTMLNQRAILIYHLTWALKLTCRDICPAIFVNIKFISLQPLF